MTYISAILKELIHFSVVHISGFKCNHCKRLNNKFNKSKIYLFNKEKIAQNIYIHNSYRNYKRINYNNSNNNNTNLEMDRL